MTSKKTQCGIPGCDATKNFVSVVIIVPRTDGQKEYKQYSFCREHWNDRRAECSAMYLARNGGHDAG